MKKQVIMKPGFIKIVFEPSLLDKLFGYKRVYKSFRKATCFGWVCLSNADARYSSAWKIFKLSYEEMSSL